MFQNIAFYEWTLFANRAEVKVKPHRRHVVPCRSPVQALTPPNRNFFLVEKLFYFSISKQTFLLEHEKYIANILTILKGFIRFLRTATSADVFPAVFSLISASPALQPVAFILHYTPSLRSSFCILPLACILPLVCSLHFTPGLRSAVCNLQSAVRSPQSAVYLLH